MPFFVYIFIHGKEKLALLQLDFQYIGEERPVQPVFPD